MSRSTKALSRHPLICCPRRGTIINHKITIPTSTPTIHKSTNIYTEERRRLYHKCFATTAAGNSAGYAANNTAAIRHQSHKTINGNFTCISPHIITQQNHYSTSVTPFSKADDIVENFRERILKANTLTVSFSHKQVEFKFPSATGLEQPENLPNAITVRQLKEYVAPRFGVMDPGDIYLSRSKEYYEALVENRKQQKMREQERRRVLSSAVASGRGNNGRGSNLASSRKKDASSSPQKYDTSSIELTEEEHEELIQKLSLNDDDILTVNDINFPIAMYLAVDMDVYYSFSGKYVGRVKFFLHELFNKQEISSALELYHKVPHQDLRYYYHPSLGFWFWEYFGGTLNKNKVIACVNRKQPLRLIIANREKRLRNLSHLVRYFIILIMLYGYLL